VFVEADSPGQEGNDIPKERKARGISKLKVSVALSACRARRESYKRRGKERGKSNLRASALPATAFRHVQKMKMGHRRKRGKEFDAIAVSKLDSGDSFRCRLRGKILKSLP